MNIVRCLDLTIVFVLLICSNLTNMMCHLVLDSTPPFKFPSKFKQDIPFILQPPFPLTSECSFTMDNSSKGNIFLSQLKTGLVRIFYNDDVAYLQNISGMAQARKIHNATQSQYIIFGIIATKIHEHKFDIFTVPSLSLSFSLSLTHTRTHSHSLSYLVLSLSKTHTHTL